MDWRFILSLVFSVIVAIFAIQNAGAIDVKFLFWELSVSQALVILLSAVFGAIAVMLLSLIRWVRLRTKIKSSAKTVATLEEENQVLRQRLEQEITKNTEAAEEALKSSGASQNN